MKITYGIIDECYGMGVGMRRSYGLAAYAPAEPNDTATVICAVHDITADRCALDALMQKCNELELSPIHLFDVVEDFIAD